MRYVTLKDARTKAGLTQAELARATHTTPMQIWRFEKGLRPITLQWAKIFAAPLKVADPASLVSNMEDFPAFGLGRPPALANTSSVGDSQDIEGDVVEASIEHIIIAYVRAMPPERKDTLFTEALDWARSRSRERNLRPNKASQIAMNV